MRIGIGYDVHRFNSPGSGAGKRPLRLGGITVPYARGLSGHSDADVLLHALADALFGAIGVPDIGEQFSSRDPRYRHADSRVFVEAARTSMQRRGWRIGNIDATVIADAPMLAGYKTQMARAIGRLLGISAAQVSVKAKTTEAFCPGKQGIAAHVVVLVASLKSRAVSRGTRGKR